MLHRYLIIDTNQPGEESFNSAYMSEELFSPGTVVFDLATGKVTVDGKEWKEVKEDHL